MTNEEKTALLAKYAAQVAKFKAFNAVVAASTDEESETQVTKGDWEDRDFYDLSIGFFVALDVPSPDAFSLALITRYDLQYWEGA